MKKALEEFCSIASERLGVAGAWQWLWRGRAGGCLTARAHAGFGYSRAKYPRGSTKAGLNRRVEITVLGETAEGVEVRRT